MPLTKHILDICPGPYKRSHASDWRILLSDAGHCGIAVVGKVSACKLGAW